MKRLSLLISCMVFGFMVSIMYIPHAKAADINVPDDYSTIQEAINAAGEGDVVLVGLGTYVEHINFLGKAIIIRSIDPNDTDVVANTIIDGNQVGNVVTFNSGEDAGSILSGFTVQKSGQDYRWSGIYCYDSSPAITNCAIIQNHTGILIEQPQERNFYPNIINCTISENYCGIQCAGSVNISNCTISENQANGIYFTLYTEASVWRIKNTNPKITTCKIIGNGRGIYCKDSSPTITNCLISDNLVDGGIYLIASSPTFINCIIAHNSNNRDGGGIYIEGDRFPVAWIPIYGVEMPVKIPWLLRAKLSKPKIINCTITGNFARSAEYEGGGIYIENDNTYSYLTITNSIIWGNSPDDINMYTIIAGRPWITYSNVGLFLENRRYPNIPSRWKYPGIGNINADPLFVDSNAGDYRLQPGSPCIERGKRRCDMGAYGTYEYRMPWSRSGRYLRK